MRPGVDDTLGLVFSQTANLQRGLDDKPRPAVLSIRLTPDERARLEREAAGQALSSFARAKLFDGKLVRGRSRGRVSDSKALARVLGAMGRSPAIGTLQGVLMACDEGAILLGAEAEDALRSACSNIEAMRLDLLKALGLRPE